MLKSQTHLNVLLRHNKALPARGDKKYIMRRIICGAEGLRLIFSKYRVTCPITDSESQRSLKSLCQNSISLVMTSNEHNKIKTLSLDVGRRKADVG